MTIHFISDLHLQQEQPHITRLFLYYLEKIAIHADSLYILGDLFETWIGDDYSSPFTEEVIHALARFNQPNKKLFLMHGNRDFLLGETFCQATGAQLLADPHILDTRYHRLLLAHGDTLCTDDVDYQKFRLLVRTPKWQKEFLSLPLEQRLATVASYRQQSKMATAEKSQEIMDVNSEQVEKVIQQYSCDLLIHGHTHRPKTHKLLINQKEYQRIVLSDWGEQGHYLTIRNLNQKRLEIVNHNFPLT